MLGLNIDTHRNMLLKYNSVLKAIEEQFLIKNITCNCWKSNIHYSDMAQTLIIMNTHLKDADNILAQKKSARVFVHKTFKMIVDDIINDGKILQIRSYVKMPVRSILNRNWKGVSIYGPCRH